MTSVIPLGRFDKIRLRDAWPTEDRHFTPWLALPENLKLLGDALGLGGLQDQQTEVLVGDFRIDVLAVDSEGDAVIIENQLEQTDHKHLGQLLTYLASQQGRGSIVWIAEDFRPEHQAAIDWLNRNTAEDFSFFGVELELWRIDNSPPAPRFKLVAQPNQWAESVREVAREVTDPQLAERHRIRLAYWQSFGDFLKKRNSTFAIKRPVKNRLYRFRMGPPDCRIVATISIQNQEATVGLAISHDPERLKFRRLLAEKAAIEADFGESLMWQEKPGTKRSLISASHPHFNPADSVQYPDVHAWMLDRTERFRSVFGPRVAVFTRDSQDEDSDE